MPRSKSTQGASSRSTARIEITEGSNDEKDEHGPRLKRTATVYDAVAGRVGLNGFLSTAQLASASILPSSPEEVLLRRIGAPDEAPHTFYNIDERLRSEQRLPDSDLVKALHAYASDSFTATIVDQDTKDFRSFDGSALLALGILLEEAAKEALGENGDMALVEPEGLEVGLPESNMTKHQIVGRVKLQRSRQQETMSETSDDLAKEQSPRKRRRAQT